MVESVVDYAIYMLDAEGRVASWNAGAERIKGYRADEIIGEHLSRFYLPEDVAAGKPRRELEVAAREGRLAEESIVADVRQPGDRGLALRVHVPADQALHTTQRPVLLAQRGDEIGYLPGGTRMQLRIGQRGDAPYPLDQLGVTSRGLVQAWDGWGNRHRVLLGSEADRGRPAAAVKFSSGSRRL